MPDDTEAKLATFWRARREFIAALREAGPELKMTPYQVEEMIAAASPLTVEPQAFGAR